MSERVTIVGHVVEAPILRRSARDLPWTRVQVEGLSAGRPLVEASAFGGLAERCAACLTAGDRVVIVAYQRQRGFVADEVAISLRHDPARSVRRTEVTPVLVLPTSVIVPTDPMIWGEDDEDY